MAPFLRTIFALGFVALAGCSQQSMSSSIPSQPQDATSSAVQSLQPSHKVAYTSLYSFKSGSDAIGPQANLVALGGKLYGTSYFGGASGHGAVFEVSTAGKEKVVHSFGTGTDGANPSASLVVANGFLYGTTNNGGANGDGTAFRMSAAGKESWVYPFAGGTDGANPAAGLALSNGALFGTTTSGGTEAEGVVFKISTSGFEQVLYSFDFVNTGTDAYNPEAPLLPANGQFFGTAYFGGTSNIGAVFAVNAAGTESVFYNFRGTGQKDGALPTAALIDRGGTFYGTTSSGGASSGCTSTSSSGCGTVFSLTSSGTERVLHSFGLNRKDGQVPVGGLLAAGTEFYGTTENGGATGAGTIFEINAAGKEKILYNFRGGQTDGANPQAGLIELKGKLYGTTYGGGANGNGTVFELTP
jgi:uncharacterized repeat protein (TIGR03803 family)